MRFDAGRVQFAEGESDTNKAPIKMLGRSAEPIYHWYWGKIVHDMSGFSTDHPTVPIDWCHDGTWEEGIGYLNSFTADENGLQVEGELISVDPKDRAATIIKKSAAGVPYQASIFFRAERLERVPEGFSAEVNGYKLEGPAIIVREWALRGMAVCLYGADHRTTSQFSDAGDAEVAVEIFSLESAMTKKAKSDPKPDPSKLAGDVSQETPPAQLSESPAPVAPVVPNQLTESPRDELKKYVAQFGAENGAKWFGDGLTFGDAMVEHAKSLKDQLSAKDQEIEGLKTKLASIDRGELTPVGFNDADKPGISQDKNDKFAHLGEGLSRFANSIKLPGAPSNN